MTDEPPKDPQVRIINLSNLEKPKPTGRDATIAFAAAIIATLLALFAFGWIIDTSYENVTGDAISYTQGYNAALLIFAAGVLFNWNRR